MRHVKFTWPPEMKNGEWHAIKPLNLLLTDVGDDVGRDVADGRRPLRVGGQRQARQDRDGFRKGCHGGAMLLLLQ